MSKRKIKFLAKIVCEYELHRYAVDVQNLEWLITIGYTKKEISDNLKVFKNLISKKNHPSN